MEEDPDPMGRVTSLPCSHAHPWEQALQLEALDSSSGPRAGKGEGPEEAR